MDYLYWVIAVAVAIKAGVMITLYTQKKKDAGRRQRQRADHDQQRERAERRQIVVGDDVVADARHPGQDGVPDRLLLLVSV